MRWEIARQQALERDGHTCRLKNEHCSERLSVHHINPGIAGEQGNDLTNLMTVCNAHHRTLHSSPETVEMTTIRVKKHTVAQLNNLGNMRDTFDSVIQRLLNESKEKRKR